MSNPFSIDLLNRVSPPALFCAILLFLQMPMAITHSADNALEKPLDFLIGGYGDGIYVSTYHPIDGSLDMPKLGGTVKKPSFICQHPTMSVIYAVRETDKGESAIFSFRWNASQHSLQQLSETLIDGDGPCYVSVDQAGMFAFVANYSSGCALVFEIGKDGSITKELDHVKHVSVTSTTEAGKATKKPRAHCIQMDPTNRWVIVADLGLDKVFVYRLDVGNGKLLRNPSFEGLATKAGAGPRQTAFHPNGKFLFVINELNSTMTAAAWDADKGTLTETSTLTTLPADFTGKNSTAAVMTNARGDIVYGSNRGHDSIAIFHFEESTGQLKLLGHQSTKGKTPRDFRLTPDGKFLLAENQQSNSIVVLAIDEKTGMLSETGKQVDVPTPSCIEFLDFSAKDSSQ